MEAWASEVLRLSMMSTAATTPSLDGFASLATTAAAAIMAN
jgi:hypothetical protein